VADEEVAQADVELAQLGKSALDLARDEVKAARARLERDRSVTLPAHCRHEPSAHLRQPA
jgi:hypothetical protein